MGTLSVRENLSFSAALRLNMSARERKARVDKVIHELGLDNCADTKVMVVYRLPVYAWLYVDYMYLCMHGCM